MILRTAAAMGVALTAACAVSEPVATAPAPTARAAPAAAQPGESFTAWREGFRARALAAGVSGATFNAAFDGVAPNARVLELDSFQPEFARPIWDYLDSAVSETRVANGRLQAAQKADALARIAARYGVEAPVFLAIWGIESAFGANYGDIPVIEALATLAYEGRRRAFGEEQLLAALRILDAGDVTPDEVRTLAEQYYGPLSASGIAPRGRPTEPPHIAERRISYEDRRVSDPYVVRNYLAPERDPGDQRQAAALTLLANILGGSGATAVLPRTLQVDEERALYASASYSGTTLDDTVFSLFNVPVPGVSLEEAEADLDRVIADFLEEGIDSEQFDRIKFQWQAGMIYTQDDAGELARMYGAALTSGLTVEDVQDWPEIIASITQEDVMRAARQIFTETPSVTGYLTAPDL